MTINGKDDFSENSLNSLILVTKFERNQIILILKILKILFNKKKNEKWWFCWTLDLFIYIKYKTKKKSNFLNFKDFIISFIMRINENDDFLKNSLNSLILVTKFEINQIILILKI